MKKKPWNQTAKIRSALRQVWRWSPVRQEALKAARIGRGSYLCASCNTVYGPKLVKVDHVETVTPLGWEIGDWTTYCHRLFDGELQVLCEVCHKKKSAVERAWKKEMKGV